MYNTAMNTQTIEKEILNLISKQHIPVGSAIPSIRNLQVLFGISRNAVCDALNALCQKGIIERGTSTRSGYLVKAFPSTQDSAPFSEERILYLLPFDSSSYVVNQLLSNFEHYFLQKRISLYFNNTKNSLQEETRLLTLVQNNTHPYMPTTLILSTTNSAHNPNAERIANLQQKMPVILVDRRIEGLMTPYIGIDNFYIGYRSTEFLIQAGHKNIVFVSGLPAISPIYDRYSGFQMAMRTITKDKPTVFWLRPGENGSVADIQKSLSVIAQKILDMNPRPTAIVCGFDRIAVALSLYYMSMGIFIPDDISLISCDNDRNVLEMSSVPISTFEHPYELITSTTYDMIESLTNKSVPKVIQKHEFYSSFILGESVKTL